MPSPPPLARAASLAAPPPLPPVTPCRPSHTLHPTFSAVPNPPSQVYADAKDAANPYPVPNKLHGMCHDALCCTRVREQNAGGGGGAPLFGRRRVTRFLAFLCIVCIRSIESFSLHSLSITLLGRAFLARVVLLAPRHCLKYSCATRLHRAHHHRSARAGGDGEEGRGARAAARCDA